jgi:hypothetical protein
VLDAIIEIGRQLMVIRRLKRRQRNGTYDIIGEHGISCCSSFGQMPTQMLDEGQKGLKEVHLRSRDVRKRSFGRPNFVSSKAKLFLPYILHVRAFQSSMGILKYILERLLQAYLSSPVSTAKVRQSHGRHEVTVWHVPPFSALRLYVRQGT